MPMNLETNYRRHFYDRYLSTHFGGIHHPSPTSLERERRVWRDYFGPLLPVNKAARIVDLGCGYGSFLYFLHEEGYRNIAGVDVGTEQVDSARRLGIPNVVQDDCGRFLEGCRQEFDCLTALDLLEHLTK